MADAKKNKLFDVLQKKWDAQSPKNKQALSVIGVVLVLVVFGVALYSDTEPPPPPPKVEKRREISLEPELLKKTDLSEAKKKARELEEKNKALQEEIKRVSEIAELEAAEKKREEAAYKGKGPSTAGLPDLPPPPPKYPPPPGAYSPGQQGAAPEPVVLGGIIVESNMEEPDPAVKEEDKKKQTVYLPPSFMEATLLSGLDAPTVESAKSNPVPVLLRIKALAVLPNRVKANLKGCFIIAHGHGSIASERAYLRLVSLSCLDRNGRSVIDQSVKGFVVDQDGKIGLRGRLVAPKLGATIWRSMAAGFFEGVGDVLNESASTQSISPLGTTSTLDTDQFVKAGAGKGISSAAKEIQEFYLELAEQAMPVIEVGASKTVTLVVQEGTELEIKRYCLGVDSCE